MCDNSGMKTTGRGKPRFTIPCDNLNISRDNYIAGMVSSGNGDALGFKNGEWGMCRSGQDIHRELNSIGGIIIPKPPQRIVSDDTVMHLATADVLVKYGENKDMETLFALLEEEYQKSMKDMKNRLVGLTYQAMCMKLEPQRQKGYRVPFNPNGGGSSSINQYRSRKNDAPPSNGIFRITYICSFYVICHSTKAIEQLGSRSEKNTLPSAQTYILLYNTGFEHENQREWSHFEEKMTDYLRIRRLLDGTGEPKFPLNFGVEKRDQFYAYLRFDGVGGKSDYDAPLIAYDATLIAYDALQGCNGNWEELCGRAMFHGGDSDSTGVIAGFLYGIVYGWKDVPVGNFKYVEYYNRLQDTASELYNLAIKV